MPASMHPDTTHPNPAHSPTVAIAGGGLAGLAAGCALAESGFRVTLFERRPYLGGRASSYQHPGTGEIVDNCQHVLFGCCTNLLEFYRRIGVEKNIRWYETMTFVEPGGAVRFWSGRSCRLLCIRRCRFSRFRFWMRPTSWRSRVPWPP